MARYRVHGQMYYRQGVKTEPGEEVTIPDEEKPVPVWHPLDAAAKAAFKRAGFKLPVVAHATVESTETAEDETPEPKPGSPKGKRTSDQSPV